LDQVRWKRLQEKEAEIARVLAILQGNRRDQVTLAGLLRRPEVGWEDLVAWLPELAAVSREVARQVTNDSKYRGYIARQQIDIERQKRLAARRIPGNFDFQSVRHLRAEAREKLSRIRPADLGQAGRISGITPADLAVLMIHLEGSH
jgi:tRNA uridine 5-carboxymethylaminomethyl modification enzyme